jgi:hypothetical protein
MASKPKLGLPGSAAPAPVPAPLPDNAKETLSLIALQELERQDFKKTAAFQSGMARIMADDALFRRIALGLIKASYGKRLKNHCRAHHAILANKKAPA